MDQVARLRLSRQEIESQAATLPMQDICEEVRRLAGDRLGDYMLDGPAGPECARIAYQSLAILDTAGYARETKVSWLMGCNHLLDGQAPALVLRHGEDDQASRLVCAAAWAFVWPN